MLFESKCLLPVFNNVHAASTLSSLRGRYISYSRSISSNCSIHFKITLECIIFCLKSSPIKREFPITFFLSKSLLTVASSSLKCVKSSSFGLYSNMCWANYNKTRLNKFSLLAFRPFNFNCSSLNWKVKYFSVMY